MGLAVREDSSDAGTGGTWLGVGSDRRQRNRNRALRGSGRDRRGRRRVAGGGVSCLKDIGVICSRLPPDGDPTSPLRGISNIPAGSGRGPNERGQDWTRLSQAGKTQWAANLPQRGTMPCPDPACTAKSDFARVALEGHRRGLWGCLDRAVVVIPAAWRCSARASVLPALFGGPPLEKPSELRADGILSTWRWRAKGSS